MHVKLCTSDGLTKHIQLEQKESEMKWVALKGRAPASSGASSEGSVPMGQRREEQ